MATFTTDHTPLAAYIYAIDSESFDPEETRYQDDRVIFAFFDKGFHEHYKRDFFEDRALINARTYNFALTWSRAIIRSYKAHDLPPIKAGTNYP